MEIKNNQSKKSLLELIWFKLKTVLVLKTVAIIVFLFLFALFFIYIGATVNKSMNDTGQKDLLKALNRRVSQLNFSFIPKHVESKVVDIEEFVIDIKFKDWEKIRYLRDLGINSDLLLVTDEMQEQVPAKIRYNNKVYKVKISLTGYTYEHIKHPYKWSLSVKVKNNETIKGMKKFALLFPEARGYLTDWVATELLLDNNVIGLRNDIISVTVNGKDHGIYYLEERYDKRLIENNEFREGIVFKRDGKKLKIYGQKKILESEELSSQVVKLKQMMHLFLNEEISVDKVFDLKKFATIFVVSDIMNEVHGLLRTNLRFYFNPVTNLIEPIGREWGYLGLSDEQVETNLSISKPVGGYRIAMHQDPVLKRLITSLEFAKEYTQQANKLTRKEYLDSLLESKSTELDILLNRIYKEQPFYIFPKEIIHSNQDFIRDKLYPKSKLINAFYKKIEKDSIILSIENKIDLPVEISHILYDGKEIILPTNKVILKQRYINKNKNEFSFFKPGKNRLDSLDYNKLEIFYSILGIDDVRSTVVFPIKKYADFSAINQSRQNTNAFDFKFISVDEKTKKISFNSNYCELSEDLIIPKGYLLIAKGGTQINLKNSARIISYSPIRFMGKEDSLIDVYSSDSSGQGIVIFNADRKSEISFVKFRNLSNISSFGWNLRGAVTFYESPVNISNCHFIGNINGDDFLNIIRTDFNIVSSVFEATNADAFDADFSNGTIKNTVFHNVGNDAIDVSGSRIGIIDVEITKFDDKGLSAGEGSHLICSNITIFGGEIAVASKDNSTIELNGLSIDSSKLAYCAFQKKSEYGVGTILVTNSRLTNVQKEHLIETGSFLFIDGVEVTLKSNKVKQMLYGEEYGKSSR